jgi:hypothetical protein
MARVFKSGRSVLDETTEFNERMPSGRSATLPRTQAAWAVSGLFGPLNYSSISCTSCHYRKDKARCGPPS